MLSISFKPTVLPNLPFRRPSVTLWNLNVTCLQAWPSSILMWSLTLTLLYLSASLFLFDELLHYPLVYVSCPFVNQKAEWSPSCSMSQFLYCPYKQREGCNGHFVNHCASGTEPTASGALWFSPFCIAKALRMPVCKLLEQCPEKCFPSCFASELLCLSPA